MASITEAEWQTLEDGLDTPAVSKLGASAKVSELLDLAKDIELSPESLAYED